jgi:hypothetical protein
MRLAIARGRYYGIDDHPRMPHRGHPAVPWSGDQRYWPACRIDPSVAREFQLLASRGAAFSPLAPDF